MDFFLSLFSKFANWLAEIISPFFFWHDAI